MAQYILSFNDSMIKTASFIEKLCSLKKWSFTRKEIITDSKASITISSNGHHFTVATYPPNQGILPEGAKFDLLVDTENIAVFTREEVIMMVEHIFS